MNDYIETLRRRYARKGILVDTNILLLWFVGALDKRIIPRVKRIQQFTVDDFETLDRFLRQFKNHLTIPNVLTEVSNLASGLGGRAVAFAQVFSRLVGTTMDEQYVSSLSATGDDGFAKLGLTDCAIMSLVRKRYLLLTDDRPLSQFFASTGGDVIHFDDIRMLRQQYALE